MSSATSKARRVFLIRASFLEPDFAGSAMAGATDLADLVRQGVHRYITRDLELDVRLSSCVEITEGVHLAGAAAEPSELTPADIEVATLPNLRDLAEALRIMSGHSMMLPERRHLAALAASAERWRLRFAARLTMPDERAVFDQAVAEMLTATFGSIRVEQERG